MVLFSLLLDGILIVIAILSDVVLSSRSWPWGLDREAMSLALVWTMAGLVNITDVKSVGLYTAIANRSR